MPSEIADYVEFGYASHEPLCCARYVFPKVFRMAGEMPTGSRVLDVGCGTGTLAGLFLDRGCRVVGIDLSERGVALARQEYPQARFEVMPADEQMRDRLEEDPFDLVVSTEVIEHLYAPGPFLRGCFDALRPSGRVIISTPYHGYLKNMLIALAGRFDEHVGAREQGGHIKFWSRVSLSAALRDAGFTDIEFQGAGRAPLVWMSMVMAGERPR